MADPRQNELTEQELIALLQTALDKTDDSTRARTVAEYSDLTGLSRTQIRAKLSLLKQGGRLAVEMVVRPNLADRFQNITAYRILPGSDED